MLLEQLEIHMQKNKKKKESRHRSSPFHKSYLKMGHRPKGKMKTMKLLEDNTGENLDELGYKNNFFSNTKGTIHERINKLDFVKIYYFWFMKDRLREWEGKSQTVIKYL